MKFDVNQWLSSTEREDGRLWPRLRCADGFEMSVQASRTHYCEPRIDFPDGLPYNAVEVGFPSAVESRLLPFAERTDDLTDTVYGWVPVNVVADVVESHGGPAK